MPVLNWISAQLNIWSSGSCVQASLGYLHGILLILNSLLEKFNVLLHIEDFLQNLQHIIRNLNSVKEK